MDATDAEDVCKPMYDNVIVQGKKLSTWVEDLHYQYSLGELYQMAKEGKKLATLVHRV